MVFGFRLKLTQSKYLHNEKYSKILRGVIEGNDPFHVDIDYVLEDYIQEFKIERMRAKEDKENRERLEQERIQRNQQRELGLRQVQDKNFEEDEPIVDSFGVRWLLCKQCGEICMEEDMSIHGGKDGVNKGFCRKCRH